MDMRFLAWLNRMDGVCLITVRPDPIWLNFLTTFKHYKVHVVVDDSSFDLTEFKKTYNNLTFIQIDNDECLKVGFKNMNQTVKKDVTGWEKAMYYFTKHPIDYVWVLEEDVYLYDEIALINIDKKFPDKDLLVGNFVPNSPYNEWHFWEGLKPYIKIPEPWFNAMMCATRLSKRMIGAVKKYADKYDTLYFLEALFPCECIANNLEYQIVPELYHIRYRDKFTTYIKSNLYHPVKDISEQDRIRKSQVGGRNSRYYVEMPSRKKVGRRHKKQRGGDSASYGFGQAVAPGAPYASEVVAKEGCMAVTRPGTLVGYSAGSGGLPGLTGFAGGGRRRKTQRGGKRGSKVGGKGFSLKKLVNSAKKFFFGRRGKKQHGGRWTADVGATTGGPNPIVPVTRIGCEGGMVNTSPPGAASPVMSFKQMGGVGGVASPFYSASTAGYGNTASTWVSSSGSPSLLQTPYEARTLNPACIKTGGGDDDDNDNDDDNMKGGGRRKQKKSKSKSKRKSKSSRRTRRR